MNLAGNLLLAFESFALNLLFGQTSVLDANGSHRSQRRQQFQMISGETIIRQRRIGINDPENIGADSERHSQHGTHALQHDSAAGKSRISLRVGGQHRFAVCHYFVDHGAADANLADFADAIAQPRHGNLQLGILVVAHHDHAAIGGDCFEHQ